MKMLTSVLTIILLFPFFAKGESIVSAIREIQATHTVSVELLALVTNERTDQLGYGLCMTAGLGVCDVNGSVGYGLCTASGKSNCSVQGSVGYGLCTAAGRAICNPNGSLGYGLCMVAGKNTCQ